MTKPTKAQRERVLWGALWRSRNLLDGANSHIINATNSVPALFRTRLEARHFIDKEYGYIRTRRDLREEPHGWMIPIPARVTVALAASGKGRGRG